VVRVDESGYAQWETADTATLASPANERTFPWWERWKAALRRALRRPAVAGRELRRDAFAQLLRSARSWIMKRSAMLRTVLGGTRVGDKVRYVSS